MMMMMMIIGRMMCALQNQPSREKDRYRVRQAFTAEEGKSLIVADYGQVSFEFLFGTPCAPGSSTSWRT